MLPAYKEEAALRLKVAAGHLAAVRRMVDDDAYCVDLMKQLSAVQGTLRVVQQVLLRNHLSSCVSNAVKHGMGETIIDELMRALKYDSSLVDGRGALDVDLPAAREPTGPMGADAHSCGACSQGEMAAQAGGTPSGRGVSIEQEGTT